MIYHRAQTASALFGDSKALNLLGKGLMKLTGETKAPLHRSLEQLLGVGRRKMTPLNSH